MGDKAGTDERDGNFSRSSDDQPEEVFKWTKKLNYGTWRYQKSWNPLHIVDAEGCYFTDANGKRYFDFSVAVDVLQPGAQESSRDSGD